MKHILITSAFGIVVASACSNGGSASTDPQQGATAGGSATSLLPEQAMETFAQRCGACHGNDGRGDGPGAATLQPKPRDFHDAFWQKSVTDQQIENTIKVGGAAVGKSPAMPAHPDLAAKPEVMSALRDVVRGFGKN